jgi:Mlc titration factor MtfA (ptsG expression regulator)
VAASAVTLSVGWPEYEWDQLTEVLLYPQEFDRDYGFERDELAGQAHPWGTVILSVPSLHESFEDPDDAFHVGLHEFAHLLDVDQTRFDGIPAGLAGEPARAWVAAAERERERLLREDHEEDEPFRSRRRRRRGARSERSVFDPYGMEDPVEFLAVAVEAFFEASLAVRREHPEVYRILADYFGQDPAAWDDARGLVLD